MMDLSLPEIKMMRLINLCATPKKTMYLRQNSVLSFTNLPPNEVREILKSLAKKRYIKVSYSLYKVHILKTLYQEGLAK